MICSYDLLLSLNILDYLNKKKNIFKARVDKISKWAASQVPNVVP